MSNLFSRRWVGGRVGRVEDGRSQGDYNLHNRVIQVFMEVILIIMVIMVIMVIMFIMFIMVIQVFTAVIFILDSYRFEPP